MSVCGQAEEESASEEAGPTREAYEQKAVSKVVRVLTVLAYLFSVSLAAILLSVYYVCVWKSPDLPPANGTGGGEGEVAALRDLNSNYNATLHVNGGGGVAVTDSFDLPANVTNGSTNTTTSLQPTIDLASTDSASTYNLPDVNGTDAVRVDNSSVT